MPGKNGNVIDFRAAAARQRRATADPVQPVTQTIERGSHNTQIAGNNNTVNFTMPAAPKVQILPSPASIGGDPSLKTAIRERFNKLGEERAKRLGKKAYDVMYKNFKRDFKIENGPWTIIWDWPVQHAPTIINYLDRLYSNTIQGRIENAAKKEGYIHKKPHLFKMETELLGFLGYTTKSPEIRQMLHEQFGVTSHAKLTQLQLWQFVCRLEAMVKAMVGE